MPAHEKRGRQTVIVFNNIRIIKVAGQDTSWRISFDLPTEKASKILPLLKFVLTLFFTYAIRIFFSFFLVGRMLRVVIKPWILMHLWEIFKCKSV